MEFQQFKFRNINPTVIQRGLVFTGWSRFHLNTEFKARAALYHIERFEQAYDRYLEVQEEPQMQTVVGIWHPSKEVVFFEFLAAAVSLTGCIDSALQEVNCAIGLGLAATRQKGKQEVTLDNVISALKKSHDTHPALEHLKALKDENHVDGKWFAFLSELRNTGVHADIYADSFETTDLKRILALMVELQSNPTSTTEIKRDVGITIGGQTYYINGLVQLLRQKVVGFVDRLHEILDTWRPSKSQTASI